MFDIQIIIMKTYTRIATYLSLFVLTLSFFSCQKDVDDVVPQENTSAIKANSATAILMQNTVTRDGSFDNIVDGASCFNIKFPYAVSVNGLELTINALEDLQLIEDIFDAITDDEDLLEIIFPITIITSDYTEFTLNGLADLRELAQECKEGGADDDIECIDFVYPISLFTFDVNLEQTGSLVVESDKDLRLFFKGLSDTDLVSIDFPISLKLYDGTSIEVNSNEELVRTLEGAMDACDEDDDNDYNDDDFDEDELIEELVECVWLVKEFKRNNEDQIGQYFDYSFDFNSDGTVVTGFRGSAIIEGTWDITFGENGAKLNLAFESAEDFTLEWSVYDIGDDRIKLFNDEGNRIVIKQGCDEDYTEPNPDTLREILSECSWIIKEVALQGEEFKRFLGYEFVFMSENVLTLSNGINTSQGTWEIKFNMAQELVVAIEMVEEPGISFEWPIREMFVNRLQFEVEEIGYELKLQRVCDNNSADADVQEIRNFMFGGQWVVTNYTVEGVNRTEQFGGFNVDFEEANQLILLEGGQPFGAGLWRVLRDSDAQLKVYLNFEGNALFVELTDDWDVVSINANRIELQEIEDDGSTTILVFEKG